MISLEAILPVIKVEGVNLHFDYKGESFSVSVPEEMAHLVQAALQDDIVSLMVDTETKQLKEKPFEGFGEEISMFEGDGEVGL